jgi:Protein of unknown function DUF86
MARYPTEAVENIERIGGYAAGLDESAFTGDRKTVDAVERCLQRVIEALDRIEKKGESSYRPIFPGATSKGSETGCGTNTIRSILRLFWPRGLGESD